MNKTLVSIAWVACIAICTSCTSTAQSTTGFGSLWGSKGDNTTTTTTTDKEKDSTPSSSTTSSGLSDFLNKLGNNNASSGENASTSTGDAITSALGSILGSVVAANQELTVADLEGTWVYTAPACKFKSEDFLKSAGGDVAASQISQKLAPTYTKLGFTQAYNYQFDAEGNFVMTYKTIPLSGTATKTEEKGYFTFEFVKFGTAALATTPAYVEVVGNKMVLLFEADKFIAMFKSIVGKLGITTLNSVFQLVDSYDGVLIGFELSKQ